MNLDIDVRFYDDSYTQLGRGQASITTANDGRALATLHQLGLAAAPVIAGMIKHAQLEAPVSLAQQAREKKEEKEKKKEA